MIALRWAKPLKTNNYRLLMGSLLVLVAACRIKLRLWPRGVIVMLSGRERAIEAPGNLKKLPGKFWREYVGETGGCMWSWLSAFVRGAGIPFSATPMPLFVWVPSANSHAGAGRV